jgi:hypothetical protein
MTRSLRVYFLSLGFREKLLLVGLVVAAVLIWLSSFGKSAGRFWQEQRQTTTALKSQQGWIDRRGAIEAAQQKAAAQFDAAKTFDLPRLYSEVRNLAREAGLTNPSTSPQQDITNGQFAFHVVDVQVQGDWDPLKKFYWLLQQRTPYIGIDSCIMQGPPRGAGPITLRIRVSSFEIVH